MLPFYFCKKMVSWVFLGVCVCALGLAMPSFAAENPTATASAVDYGTLSEQELLARAEKGDAKAMVQLGIMQVTQKEHKNTAQGLQWLRKAAETSAIYAHDLANYLYFGELYGIDRTKDRAKEAIKVTVAGAKAGDPKAVALLAYLFLERTMTRGVSDEGYEKAFPLAQTAARRDDPMAFAVLGWLHYMGKVAPQDAEQAFLYAKQSAEAGNAIGMGLLSQMYFVGAGTAKDAAQAAHWAERAAQLGDNYGRTLLGVIYLNGEGKPKDVVLGYAYILLAAQHEDMAARSYRETEADKLTQAEREQAQEQVKTWRKSWGFAE